MQVTTSEQWCNLLFFLNLCALYGFGCYSKQSQTIFACHVESWRELNLFLVYQHILLRTNILCEIRQCTHDGFSRCDESNAMIRIF